MMRRNRPTPTPTPTSTFQRLDSVTSVGDMVVGLLVVGARVTARVVIVGAAEDIRRVGDNDISVGEDVGATDATGAAVGTLVGCEVGCVVGGS